MDLCTQSLITIFKLICIRSFLEFSKIEHPPYSLSALPQKFKKIALYLNRFRRKPAISEFD